MRGFCPECETLQDITDSGEPLQWSVPPGGSMPLPKGTSTWKLVSMHPDKRRPPEDGRYPICVGSGRRI